MRREHPSQQGYEPFSFQDTEPVSPSTAKSRFVCCHRQRHQRGCRVRDERGVSKAPYVYVGVYNGNAIAPIAGYTGTPQVGNSVCYTGTQSGQVCSNTVTRVNQYICYSYIPAQCYGGLTVTEQSNGVPAAGNGDSGGPVISAIGGVAYASGIISGISNPGSNCTGKPSTDTRKCSTTAIYAPISHFFNNNGGHAIYVAPSS